MTLRSRMLSWFQAQLSLTMKFPGLIPRRKTEASWQVATASHICANMEAMRRRRVSENDWDGGSDEGRSDVGGV